MANLKSVFSVALRFIIIGGVAIFISFLFPNHAKFKYNFKQTQKWTYEDLIAPFDYPIIKDEAILEIEKEAIKSTFIPYYRINKNISETFISELTAVLASENIEEQQAAILDKVKAFYADGVISLNPDHIETQKLIISNENVNKTVNVSNLNRRDDLVEYLESSTNNNGKVQDLITRMEIENVVYDEALSSQFLDAELDNLSSYIGKVSKGELIVQNGEIITSSTFQSLKSFEVAYMETISGDRAYLWIFAGYFLLTILIVSVLLLYLNFHFSEVYENWIKLSFILMWLVLFAYLVFVVENTNALSTYIIPFCITPIIIKNFYNERLALFVHIVVVLIASFLSTLGYEFTFMQIFVGIVTVLLVGETREWNKFFGAISFIFIAYGLSYIGLELIKEGNFLNIDWTVFIYLLVNAVLTLLAYPFIPLLERLFGFTSSISLAELNDMNQPLLKQLSIKAPGTLQHSFQVANLAEAAADKIGANSLLLKTGAMYHDIGKMLEPQYFIENQSGQNMHESLDNFESAKKIIDHVTEGVKMAKKAKLPQVIIDFITTHHGTTRVEYFYRNQINDFPDQSFDESLFRYPGPKPKSKEQTILMLADSLEAACKSLKSPTGKDIDEMVNKIIAHKLELGQMDDSELNFDELEKCKTTFSALLRSIHHVRIEYPK